MGLFSTIAKVGGSLLGGVLANKGAKSAASTQMRFQKQSAQKGYQWAVNDMKKAGINPMLAYQQGGSSALSGASFRPENVIGPAVSTAMQTERLNQELKNMAATVTNTEQQTKTQKAIANAQLADAAYKISSARNMAMQTQLISTRMPQAQTFKNVDQHWSGKVTNWGGKLLQNLGVNFGGQSKDYRKSIGVGKRR